MQFRVNYTHTGNNQQQFSILQEVVENRVNTIPQLSILLQKDMDLLVRLQQHNEAEFVISFSIDLFNETLYIVIKGGKIRPMVDRLIERLLDFLNQASMDQH